MNEPQTLLSGLAFPESPRWHEDRLWCADWGAQALIAVDLAGASEVILAVPSFPFSIDWLPDGRLLIVSASERTAPAPGGDGSLVTHADLSGLSDHPWNEIVVDGRGNAYVNNIGFDFPDGEFAPGIVALVTPDGAVRQVADDVAFPNGMAVTPDNATLIVAESYGNRLTAFDIDADGSLVEPAGLGRARRASPTAFASMRKAPSGTGTSPTSAACACARAARCCRRSRSTAAASPACSAARTAGHCSWQRTNGAARRAWPLGRQWARSSPLRRRPRTPAGLRRAANRSEPPASGAE